VRVLGAMPSPVPTFLVGTGSAPESVQNSVSRAEQQSPSGQPDRPAEIFITGYQVDTFRLYLTRHTLMNSLRHQAVHRSAPYSVVGYKTRRYGARSRAATIPCPAPPMENRDAPSFRLRLARSILRIRSLQRSTLWW